MNALLGGCLKSTPVFFVAVNSSDYLPATFMLH